MTDQDGIKLTKRIERWQKRLAPLGIGHWQILCVSMVDAENMPERSTGRSNAAASVARHYDSVNFWFNSDYLEDCTPQELDTTIIHEWLHVAFRDVDEALEVIESWMPEATYADFDKRMTHEYEGVIERLARLIYTLHSG